MADMSVALKQQPKNKRSIERTYELTLNLPQRWESTFKIVVKCLIQRIFSFVAFST